MYKYQLCKSEANPVDAVHIAGNAYIDHWQWSVTGGYITYDNPYGDNSKATLRPISNYFTVKIKAHNACGWSQWADMGVSVINCGGSGWYMNVSPNPATSEATLTIKNNSKQEQFDGTAQWELEIYNQGYMLQEKQNKLKGNTFKLNTSSWKEGIYYIKATYKGEIVSGKLIIKK
ncbi:MAG: T9SS type A sorting domain-containing protein [Bacteroidales bacterium]|nr:T9SS type A sorting domain-containing protein [Bacteroidales bacterium]